MRLKVFLAFGLGFAAGMLVLAAALWSAGKLNSPAIAALPATTTVPPVPAGASAAPATDVVRETPPPVVRQPVPSPVHLDRDNALAMPIAGVDASKLTSNFSENRDGRAHEALDIMAPRGTPVRAADQGNVVKLFTSKQGGLTVYQFNDAQDLCYYYAHLDRYAAGLKEGMLLRRGDVLGYVGTTGNAPPDAPHLHFAVFRLGPERQWWKGTAIDPLPLLLGTATAGAAAR